MDMNMVQQVEDWMQREFANKQTVSKDELVQHAQGSNLPNEAKQSLQGIPQGTYDKNDLMGKVRDTMMSQAGSMTGGMGGMGGGQGGGMGGY